MQIHLAPDDGYFRVRHVGDAENMAELGKEHLKFGPGGLTALDTRLKRIAPGFFEIHQGFGPASDVASTVLFRTKNIVGNLAVDHVFGPTDTLHGLLGSADYTWYGAFVKYYTSPLSGRYQIRNSADDNPMLEILQDSLSFGPGGEIALDTWLRRVGAGIFELRYEIIPPADGAGKIGHSDARFGYVYATNLDATNFAMASITIGSYLVITTDRVLQNVAADAAIITGGQFSLARLPRDTSGYVLEAQGAGFDPMYVDPDYRYAPAAHQHSAEDITSGGVTADVNVAKVGGGTRTLHFSHGLYTGYTDS